MSTSALANEVTKEVLRSVIPLFEDVKLDVRRLEHKITNLDEKLELKIIGLEEKLGHQITDLDEKLELKIIGLEEKLGHQITDLDEKLELKIIGLGIQMDQMDSKIDTALELTTTVPALEISNENHDCRLKKIETDIQVLKLVVSRSAK